MLLACCGQLATTSPCPQVTPSCLHPPPGSCRWDVLRFAGQTGRQQGQQPAATAMSAAVCWQTQMLTSRLLADTDPGVCQTMSLIDTCTTPACVLAAELLFNLGSWHCFMYPCAPSYVTELLPAAAAATAGSLHCICRLPCCLQAHDCGAGERHWGLPVQC